MPSWSGSHGLVPQDNQSIELGRGGPFLDKRRLIHAQSNSAWLALAGSFLVVGLLYGPVLGFSFLFDDTFDLPRVEGRGYLSLLTSSEGYSYYRPGPFLLWKLSHDILGYYNAPLLHAMTLLAHALAGWLFYLLVSRLGAGNWALLPALLFLTYPFSYQNVAIVGTLFHPMAGAAILASLNLYLMARTTGGRSIALHLAALGATAVALWSHESGVVVLPLVVGIEGLLMWRNRTRRFSLWVFGHVAAAIGFVLTWLAVERTPSAERVVLEDMHPKALFFAQGFTYPLSAQIQWLEREVGWSPGIIEMTVLSLCLVGGAYLLAWRKAGWSTALVFPIAGVAIALVATLPVMARLSWEYVEDAPRLLYLVGAGAALFWGLLPMLDFGRRGPTTVWRLASGGLIVAVLAQSWVFVDARLEMFALGSQAVDEVVSAGERHAGRGLVIVNAPSWLAMDAYEYPYGNLGVQVMPAYIGLDRVVYTSSRHASMVDAVSVASSPDVDGIRYTFGPHGVSTAEADLESHLRDRKVVVWIDRHGDTFTAREVGRLIAGAAESHEQLVQVAGGDVFAGPLRYVRSEERLTLYVSWHVLANVAGERVTVEMFDDAGRLVDRHDGASLGGLLAPSGWSTGDRIDDSFQFERPPRGPYRIVAGVDGALVEIGRIDVP